LKIECHLVIVKKKGKEPRVVRATQGRPALNADEAMVKLSLDLPQDTFDAPLVTVPVEKRQIAVAVEVDEL
jgi:hypothetical protein